MEIVYFSFLFPILHTDIASFFYFWPSQTKTDCKPFFVIYHKVCFTKHLRL